MAVQQVTAEELELLVHGGHGHPHAVLGPHVVDDGVVVRIFKPLAKTVRVAYEGEKGQETADLEHLYAGIWAGTLPVKDVPGYRVHVDYGQGEIETDDPYRFLPTLGEMDLHLINEGRHELLWTVLGAHLHEYAGGITARRSPSGRRRPRACASRATSTTGTAASTRCASSARRASGSCSCPTWATGRSTSS